MKSVHIFTPYFCNINLILSLSLHLSPKSSLSPSGFPINISSAHAIRHSDFSPQVPVLKHLESKKLPSSERQSLTPIFKLLNNFLLIPKSSLTYGPNIHLNIPIQILVHLLLSFYKETCLWHPYAYDQLPARVFQPKNM